MRPLLLGALFLAFQTRFINPGVASAAATYDRDFFQAHKTARDAGTYEKLARWIRLLSPVSVSSVLDVGCGHGFLTEALRHQNLSATCLEGSASAAEFWPTDPDLL